MCLIGFEAIVACVANDVVFVSISFCLLLLVEFLLGGGRGTAYFWLLSFLLSLAFSQ